MSDIVIRAEGLGKKYRIGASAPYHRFSELLSGVGRAGLGAVTRPFRRPTRPSPSTPGPCAPQSDPTEFWALRDVNFEIKQGEVVGIIGRNGAGKSTLLKVLSRITEPTTGRFGVRGRVASLLEVGTGFHPELTGRENIFVSGVLLGMTRAEVKRRFDEIVAFSGVEKFLDTPVKRYSSGMQVRLGFAVAAHLESEILIIDEVLAVGDAEFQKRCLGKMGDVAKSGRTVLFVSHNMGAVASLCTQAVILAQGRLSYTGTAATAASIYAADIREHGATVAVLSADGFGIIESKVVNREAADEHAEPTFFADDIISFEFCCNLPATSTSNLGLTVYSHDKNIPAVSASVRESGQEISFSGLVIVRTTMPANRLPTGSYRVEAVVENSSRVFCEGDHLAYFSIVNTQHNRLGTIPRAPTLVGSAWEIVSVKSCRTYEP